MEIKIINGVGILNPDIAIVGEAPGAEEEQQGKPFVGRSGQLINSIMSELGIDRSKCYITNVVKFRPEGNRTPTDQEIIDWRGALMEELLIVNPKVIVALGSVATRALVCSYPGENLNKLVKITQMRGNLIYSEYMNRQFLATLHPSYCLRNPNETDKLKADFKTALGLVK